MYCLEIEQYEKEERYTGSYILFGAGKEGKRALRILKACSKGVVAWCDNNKAIWNKTIEGLHVISISELLNHYIDKTIIITAGGIPHQYISSL